MEDVFFDAVTKASQSAGPLQGPGSRRSRRIKMKGSDTGAQATQTVERLLAQAQTMLRDGRATGMRAAQAMLDSYAAMASGVLIGMSEGLQAGTKRSARSGSGSAGCRAPRGGQAAAALAPAQDATPAEAAGPQRRRRRADRGDDAGDPRLDGRVVADRPAPFARGLARPLVGRVQAHLAAQAATPARRSRGSRSACWSTSVVSRTGSIRVVMAQTTSGQSRMSTSSSVTTMNLVYMNWRRKLHIAEHHPLGVAGIALADADDRQPVAAALGRQVEVDDLGKLLLQDRHEHLVQRHAEHGRLVGRLAGVGGVVDRVAPVRHAVDLEHREPVLLVVVAGVVAERAFERVQVAADLLRAARRARCVRVKPGGAGGMWPSSTNSARRRHLQHHAGLADAAVGHLGAAAAQQAGELVFGQRVGHRRDGAEDRRRIGAQRHRDRKRAGPGVAGANSRKSSAPPRWASQRMITWRRPITCWR